MIVFTVTNKVTQQVYVGTTRDSADERWSQLVLAAGLPLDYPLYEEIRQYGAHNFIVQEWAEAESREELAELEQEAIASFNAQSLRGYRTSIGVPAAARSRVDLDLDFDQI